jgi:hypothetical protein
MTPGTDLFERVLLEYPAHYVALGFMSMFGLAVFSLARLGPMAVIGDIYKERPVLTVVWTLGSSFATSWFALVAIRGFSQAIGVAVGWR